MTKDLNNCTDARKWAESFVEIRNKHFPDTPMRETVETIECWFASALLAGRKWGMDETNEIWLNRCGFIAKQRGGIRRTEVTEEERFVFCRVVIKSGAKVCFVPETGEETKLTRALEVRDAVWGVNGGPGWVFNFNEGQPRAYTVDINNCEEIYP